ncbi:MAG TPA: helix-turn-helix domain-containing protein [Candidatus Dormibacteraeota bacterium]|nr:helix-turn-helix domain-containing protein [Candidatus Dormibacteraeota bacterium]
MARRVVVAPHRDGGQAQYIERSVGEAGESLAGTRAWALAHLGERISLSGLAERAHLSPRTLIRRFQAETGLTPLRWISQQRLLVARGAVGDDRPGDGRGGGEKRAGQRRQPPPPRSTGLGTVPTGYRRAFGGD